ncbi:hypothetical protein [Marinomonas transparens]|uniref:Outer membrane protein beta-barrel domain-containing protein n=1 Tax=Marinomonas transparens TaxID=2795388 RepID=A0A934JY28_9GAMM|nr:hypothetical protein [Marinomonas transparens]MBJ7539052.1 hypothetical protein [Marinomonas transparens]
MKLVRRFVLSSASMLMVLSCDVYAKEEQESQSIVPSVFVEVSGGDGAEHLELAVGLEPDDQIGSFAGLYISQSSLGEDGTVKEVGITAFNFAEVSSESYGAEMHIALSRTSLDQYERRGAEVGVNLYGFFTESFALFVGASLRPRFFSLDWSNDELFEVSSNIGLRYQLPYNLSIFTQYQYDNFIKNNWKSSKIADHGMVGMNWLF